MPSVTRPAAGLLLLAAIALIGAIVLTATGHPAGKVWAAFFACLTGAGVAVVPAHHTTRKD